jgi:hypothetical protein
MIHGQDAAGRRASVDNQRANGRSVPACAGTTILRPHDKHVIPVKAGNRHARGGRAGEVYRFGPIAWYCAETPWQVRRQPGPYAVFLFAYHAIGGKRKTSGVRGQSP